jgi:hypothetical protein
MNSAYHSISPRPSSKKNLQEKAEKSKFFKMISHKILAKNLMSTVKCTAAAVKRKTIPVFSVFEKSLKKQCHDIVKILLKKIMAAMSVYERRHLSTLLLVRSPLWPPY